MFFRRNLLFFLIFLLYGLAWTVRGQVVFEHIRREQTDRLLSWLEENDINGRYGIDSITPLIFSIRAHQPGVADLLLGHGADPDLSAEGKVPLVHAILLEQKKTVRHLLKAGANINHTDSLGNTPLIYAASTGNLRMVKILLRHGAHLNHKNKIRRTAYDHAVRSGNPEIAGYLRDKYERNLPDLTDGPYVKWNRGKRIRTFYMVHDSARHVTRKVRENYKSAQDTFTFQGYAGDTSEYTVFREHPYRDFEFDDVEKLVILGDIHGTFDSLVNLLQFNRVIDENLDWNWGRGHVLFLGDIFDRGNQVTETLWFIYRLEQQADHAGGAVHYILGNHEIMILSGDYRYLSDKYYYLTDNLNIHYTGLFNKRTVPGRWLRTKHTVIRINDMLFVHGGLSPPVAELGLSVQEINDIVWYTLRHPNRKTDFHSTQVLLFGELGPFWYRGYIEDNSLYSKLSEKELTAILDQYKVSRAFIGHTNVERINAIYGRVYTMDVPFYTYGYNMEAILYRDGDLFRISTFRPKEKIE